MGRSELERSRGSSVARRALDLDIDLPEIDLDLRCLQNDRGALVEVRRISALLAHFACSVLALLSFIA